MNKSQENVVIDNIRHSLAHLLAAAVLQKFPKAQLGIGPVIENGFYYDIKLPKAIAAEDIKELEAAMRDLARKHLDFRGEKITPAKARALFKNQPFKLDLVKDFAKEKKQLTAYHTGEFIDLCRGGHVKNTSEIHPDAFRLTKIAAAYWKGDEKNPQLTRIYGVAFRDKKELEDYLHLQDEIAKRDHKKLGQELDLFTFSDLVGGGLPLWTPKGTILRTTLDDFVWKLRRARGYQKVEIPHITKKDLYEKSGHWEKFKDELFKIVTREHHDFVMKPMNCPHHAQIYARRQWSWRELPQRYANTTMVYRDEQTGELSGLARVRSITQDDAHVFCRSSQARGEINAIWDMIDEFYKAVGFQLGVRLSLHDSRQPKKYLGSPKIWKQAEEELRSIARERGIKLIEAKGEAAFYGPKIDFMAHDSLGREWQVATIQLDMNQPERFDLACINEKGEKERIIMIHCAIMGSIERYLSILIEHFAGAFPVWLAPVQAAIIPVSEKVAAYALSIASRLAEEHIRVELHDRNETLGRRIREAEMQKIPYLVVVGEREAEQHTISVRERGKGDIGSMPLEDFIARLTA